ncbi:transposase [Hymenobacter sp. BRD67]|uniref:transposase n=1 Tax=Hymenobacter sp. BRD67 TaxID=2675877 RepID=UPI0015641B34|nr:transposase [Hymenobacter sp. BRD67]QKG54068.1 transposase [Hymenobacter sp. BRD67]
MRTQRREFVEAIQHEDVTRLKFVEETRVNLTYTRRNGRAPGRQRVDAAVPLHNGPNVTVIAARSAPGVEAVMELDGAVNKASFAVSVEQVLGPGLQSGDVVVLASLPVHKAAGRAKLVEARGARLLYPPPYSPDFTPIGLAFSKLKTTCAPPPARPCRATCKRS